MTDPIYIKPETPKWWDLAPIPIRGPYLNPKDNKRRLDNARAALMRIATPSWADKSEIDAIYKKAKKMTSDERRGYGQHAIEYVVDHIIPLKGKSVCGLHTIGNLRIITKEENARKYNFFNESIGTDQFYMYGDKEEMVIRAGFEPATT